MGKRLDGFDVRLEFDPDGGVVAVFYKDAEGCGHEKRMDVGDSIRRLVEYHLSHYRRSHDMAPQPWCQQQLGLVDGTVLRCTVDPKIPHEEHTFTWRKR